MKRAILAGAVAVTGMFIPSADAGTGTCTGQHVINTISIGGMFNCTLDTAGYCTQVYGQTAFGSFPSAVVGATATYATCLVF